MVPRAMGVVQGSRIRNRTSHLKRNCCRSSSARMWPKTTTTVIETKVKMKVLTREVRKAWSWMISMKFRSPTILKSGLPTVTLLRLKMKDMMKGKPTRSTM